MKMNRLIIILGFALLSISAMHVKAQDTWTLEECIQYALEHNIEIKRRNISAEQAENNHQQSKFELFPDLNGNASHSFRSGKNFNYDVLDYVNQDYQYGQFGLHSNLNIFNGLETQNRIKQEKYNMLSQLESIKEARYDVTMNIVTYYLNVLANIEQKQIKEEQLQVTLDQIEKTQQEVEVGNKAKGDLLEIEAQAARERVELTQAKNDLRMAYLDLTQLMNLDSADKFQVYIPEEESLQPDASVKSADIIYKESVKQFPTIKNAEFQVKSSEKNLAIMKGRRYPSLDFDIQVGSYYNELRKEQLNLGYDKQMEENLSMIMQLSLNIPIFNNRLVSNQIQNARLSLEDSRFQLQENKQNLFKNIQRARNEAIAAYEDYQANREAVESSQEAFNYARERYDVGLVDIVEYKVAKKDLTEAKLNAAQAKYNYFFRIKILEFYMGKELQI